MAFTHVISQGWNKDDRSLSGGVSSSGSLSTAIDETLASDSNLDQEVAGTIDLSALKSLVMMSDQDVTVKTNGVKATSTLTFTVNPSNTQIVVLDGLVYTFQTVLTDLGGNVLIGATASDSLDNLIAAVTLGAGAGTLYAASTVIHPRITAAAGAGDTMLATSKEVGTAGNSYTASTNVTGASWSDSPMTGGVNPDDTFLLKLNKPLLWDSSSGYFTNPITADVTKWFVRNSSGSSARVQVRSLEDATP